MPDDDATTTESGEETTAANLLASKAASLLLADDANLVAKVAAGKTLSTRERERLEKLAARTAATSEPSAPAQPPHAPVALTPEERAKPALVLHAETNGPRRTAEQAAADLGIARRTFFRWKAAGDEHNDPCPFAEPLQIEAWYERMLAAGAFSNRLPSKLRETLLQRATQKTPPAYATPPAPPAVPSTPSTPSAPIDHGDAIGLDYEVIEQTRHVANLRRRRDEAYARNDFEAGDALAKRHMDAVDHLSILMQRAQKHAEAEGRSVTLDLIVEELRPKLAAIVRGGLNLIDRIAPALDATNDPKERRQVWQSAWRNHIKDLGSGRLAAVDLDALIA